MRSFLITACLGVCFVVYGMYKEHEKFRTKCEILKKYKGVSSRYKSSDVYIDYTLVMKEHKYNQVVDLQVTPSTFFTSNVGDIVTFNLCHATFKTKTNGGIFVLIGFIIMISPIVLIIIQSVKKL